MKIGDKVWFRSTCNWHPGTIEAVGRFRVLVSDDTYKTIWVTHWRRKRRVFERDVHA